MKNIYIFTKVDIYKYTCIAKLNYSFGIKFYLVV